MNRKILSSLQLILIFVLFFFSHTQNGFSQNGSTKKQISILAGYSPVHIGSKIDHDKRFALSFRLKKDQLMYDFDFEFYTSSNTWSGLVRNNELWVSTNSQETSGFLVSLGLAKAMLKNSYFGVGLSGSYFDISQSLFESVHSFETGEEITDQELSPVLKDKRFFAPGVFVQSDLSFPISQRTHFYLKQKLNWIYIANHLESSFLDSWLSYSVFGGLRFTI